MWSLVIILLQDENLLNWFWRIAYIIIMHGTWPHCGISIHSSYDSYQSDKIDIIDPLWNSISICVCALRALRCQVPCFNNLILHSWCHYGTYGSTYSFHSFVSLCRLHNSLNNHMSHLHILNSLSLCVPDSIHTASFVAWIIGVIIIWQPTTLKTQSRPRLQPKVSERKREWEVGMSESFCLAYYNE